MCLCENYSLNFHSTNKLTAPAYLSNSGDFMKATHDGRFKPVSDEGVTTDVTFLLHKIKKMITARSQPVKDG